MHWSTAIFKNNHFIINPTASWVYIERGFQGRPWPHNPTLYLLLFL